MKIGLFRHWFRPPYEFASFLRDELGLGIEKIDHTRKGYLEPYDVVIIEQNGFNDFIENDELYFRDYIHRGGICWFMHQDFQRWAKYFLPEEIGFPYLVNRYVSTIGGMAVDNVPCKGYLMPCVEDAGRKLFTAPNRIDPEDFAYWMPAVNSFGITSAESGHPETVKSTALSCVVDFAKWEVLGSYMDPAITNGALVLQAKYGKGLYFWNQILFPEVLDNNAPRVLEFWKKYVPNVLAHFERCRKGGNSYAAKQTGTLPLKRNYRTAIHVHALDWYGADTSLASLQAAMRYKKIDICTLAVKDAIPYGGKLNLEKFSDDKLLMIHGQEYHPFNWTEVNAEYGHNAYHLLSIGNDQYTPEFTCSLFSTEEVDAYLKKAIDFVHENGGAVCATHPYFDFWTRYRVDAVDHEPIITLEGTDYEKFYARGGKVTFMNSVDMWGVQRLLSNAAENFIYIEGIPCRDSLVAAVKAGHVIATELFESVDVTLDQALPGDSVAPQGDSVLKIQAMAEQGNITQVRVFSGGKRVLTRDTNVRTIDLAIPLAGLDLKTYVRVEIQGENPRILAVTTPFYLF